jgi:hypothetical protein
VKIALIDGRSRFLSINRLRESPDRSARSPAAKFRARPDGEPGPAIETPTHLETKQPVVDEASKREGAVMTGFFGKYRRVFEIGGMVAGVVLVAFGVAALYLGWQGGRTVQSSLKNEYIVGSNDMKPSAIAAEIKTIQATQQKIATEQKKAGIPPEERYTFTEVSAPDCSVAGEQVTTGDEARCFAQYMRIHALGSSSGLTYSQMGRFQAKSDAPLKFTDFAGGTDDPMYAVTNAETQQPVANGARNTWVTETALTSALNLAYTASQISLFGAVVGIALLLSGVGFLILAIGGALRHAAQPQVEKEPKAAMAPAAGAR